MARLALLLMLLPAAAHAHRRAQPLQPSCDAELQVVMCGDIPVTEVRDRAACCRTYRPQPTMPAQHHQISAAALEESVFFASILRPDLYLQTGGVAVQPIDWRYGSCTMPAVVQLPVFPGPRSAPVLQEQVAPQLTQARIRAVKQRALEQLPLPVRAAFERIRQLNTTSGFAHPATCIGPAELALLQQRLADGSQPQTAAKMSLLTGFGVAPKMYPGLWHPPTDTPVDYPGPFAIPEVDVKYNGLNGETATCPDNYPSGAPRAICAHISFVELDAQMTYKSAIAYLATGDNRYAANVFRIVEGWADTNKAWGRSTQNGPLEAGWGCAAMAKALELLRNEAPAGLIDKFVSWMDTVITPQIDNFLDVITVKTVERGEPAFNNWHSTIGECEMSMALLTDNRTRFDRAVDVFHKTVTDYLTWGWGHGQFNQTRFRGECTETMRDIYHTEFGLAGLLQMAEMAWQQDEDLFSSNGHVLAAAMELHARIIRAAPLNNVSDPDMLPAGFAPFDTMPKPPAGCIWKFYTQTQLWAAINMTSGAVVAQLQDGVKYVVGNVFLPTGWEVGYNHFAGRLGMKLPETAALLAKYWPEKYDFHWGLGTLSHAGTAAPLWRAGIDESALCGEAFESPAVPSEPGDEPAVPSRPGDKPAVPSRPGDKPAVPSKPVAPMKPGGEPAVPARPGGEPAVPSEPAVSPAAPQEPAQSPAEPETDEPATSADPAAGENPPEQPAEPADRSLEEKPASPAAEPADPAAVPAEPASPVAEPAQPASLVAEPAQPASPAAETAEPAAAPAEPASLVAEPAQPASPAAETAEPAGEPADPAAPPQLMLPSAGDASVQPADLAAALPAAGR